MYNDGPYNGWHEAFLVEHLVLQFKLYADEHYNYPIYTTVRDLC